MEKADILIRGATVIDGTGRPGFQGDIAIGGSRILAVGDCSGLRGREEIDAEGLTAAPGFIDAHAHSDTMFVKDASGASKLYQGITTEISGNCGASPFPKPEGNENPWRFASYADFLQAFDERDSRMAVNQAMLAGHGSLRESVVGESARPATSAEMVRMKALLRRDLEAGALGMSLGLEYAPGCFAGQEELNALGAVVKEAGGLVTCHMRSEGLRIFDAIEELAQVGRVSGVHVHISHIKLDHYSVHGQAPAVWEHIEKLRQEGIHITADVYPYTASATSLTIRCPRWSMDGGEEALLGFLAGDRRREVVEGIRSHYFNAQRAETCLFSDGGLWPEIVGKTLRFVAEEMLHTDDYAEAAAIVLERTKARAKGVFFVMSEEDMLYFLSKDVCIGSDGYALPADPEKVGSLPHPRSYGSIAEFLRLAREKNICSLEEAVRRVTSKPADTFGLTDRGRVAPGMAADLTIFDPAAIAPRATYLNPIQTAQGVHWVIVNGKIALREGRQTEERAGRFLTRGLSKRMFQEHFKPELRVKS
ncbi:MAG: D-aminoacylase [Clostridia bacterium]|nr:D-aminoacylase [Clostridia bacterium]